MVTSDALEHEVNNGDHENGPGQGGRGEVFQDGSDMEELGQRVNVLVVHIRRGEQVPEVGGKPHWYVGRVGRRGGGGNVPHQVLDKLYACWLFAT